jgi:RNA 3'-terminal phosphate cyclase
MNLTYQSHGGGFPWSGLSGINCLLPMALAGGGEFVTMPVTQHFESHVAIIEKFLSKKVVTEDRKGLVQVRLE